MTLTATATMTMTMTLTATATMTMTLTATATMTMTLTLTLTMTLTATAILTMPLTATAILTAILTATAILTLTMPIAHATLRHSLFLSPWQFFFEFTHIKQCTAIDIYRQSLRVWLTLSYRPIGDKLHKTIGFWYPRTINQYQISCGNFLKKPRVNHCNSSHDYIFADRIITRVLR